MKPDTNDQSTGQLTNAPADNQPTPKAYVGVSATELEEIGAETYHGTGDTYMRDDIQDFKDAIVANENMTAEPMLFEIDTDQRGETNNVEQRAEDGDSQAVEHPADNPGLSDPGDGDPTTDDAYENQSNKPKAHRQHGSDERPGEPGTIPDSNNSQQEAKLG